jgi:hypothetical protein
MKKLNKGDLICRIPSCLDLYEGKPPIVGIVIKDWDCDIHGDYIEVWYQYEGETSTDPYCIQRLEEYGQYGT